MPSDARQFLRFLSDEYIQVRRLDGSLVGVLPQVPASVDYVQTATGQRCDIMQGIILGVIVPDDVDPRHIAGFIPRTGAPLDPPLKADGSVTPTDQEPVA